jgi:hypothetical protein
VSITRSFIGKAGINKVPAAVLAEMAVKNFGRVYWFDIILTDSPIL